MKSISTVAVALSLGSAVHAGVSHQYINSEVGFSLSIPQSTVDTGSGDVFFQLTAPTTYSWVGLGQGGQMAGANYLIMYTSSDGTNVTVSPRMAGGENMPTYNSGARITVLEGSGVKNGIMTANIMCSSCSSWSGGSMDFAAQSADFIYGLKTGSPLNSDSPSENIDQHTSYGPFKWPIAQARSTNDANPFTASSTTSTSGTTTQSGTTSMTSVPVVGGASNAAENTANMLVLSHAVVACVAFIALFPTGGILIRVASFTGLLWVHAALQGFAVLFYAVAFGMGIYIASVMDLMDEAHAHIGIILMIALVLQPVFGFVHHIMFKRYGTRTFWSHAHLWLGRLIIPGGMVNGYLGIDLAGDASTSERVAYVAIASVMLTLYVIAVIYGEFNRWKKSKELREPDEKDMVPRSDRQQRRQSYRLQDLATQSAELASGLLPSERRPTGASSSTRGS